MARVQEQRDVERLFHGVENRDRLLSSILVQLEIRCL
jgi:hypothetical protein